MIIFLRIFLLSSLAWQSVSLSLSVALLELLYLRPTDEIRIDFWIDVCICSVRFDCFVVVACACLITYARMTIELRQMHRISFLILGCFVLWLNSAMPPLWTNVYEDWARKVLPNFSVTSALIMETVQVCLCTLIIVLVTTCFAQSIVQVVWSRLQRWWAELEPDALRAPRLSLTRREDR